MADCEWWMLDFVRHISHPQSAIQHPLFQFPLVMGGCGRSKSGEDIVAKLKELKVPAAKK
jgi:hypothetical protein